jgi:class 3 adenylate cyclase/streptogramin lyase
MGPRSARRVLAAVLFTDIVDSSVVAGHVGDARWKELIARHHAIVRRELKRYGGRELDTAGDGFFARFTEPAAAIRCACAASESVRQLGIEIRAGAHFGECEQVGGKLGGLTVVVGARVMALGGPGDVLVTGTARELAGGAGLGFEDRGRHSLKGVDGTWQVLAVTEVDGAPRSGPADPKEAQQRLADVQPSRLRSRTRLVVGALIALAAGAAITSFALLGGNEEPTSLERIPPDRVGTIDPSTNAIETALNVGSKPTGVTVGADAAWITRLEAEILSRVDLASEEVETLSTHGHPAAIGLDDKGFVWVLNGFEATVVRIDPRRMVIEDTFELPTGTKDLAVGEGAVWVTNADERTVTRLDLVTRDNEVVELSGIGMPDGVAVGDGAVWVAGSGGVAKVDSQSRDVLGTWPLRFPASEVAVGEGAVWVTHQADDHVSKVDEATGASTYIPVGNGPAEVAVGGGAVWVTNSLDGTLSKIHPKTNNAETIHLGSSPEGVAFGDGSVWVAVHVL